MPPRLSQQARARFFVVVLALLTACDTFRVRITDVTSRAAANAQPTFAQVVEVTSLIAVEKGLTARQCTEGLNEQCRAYSGPVSLEIYPVDAATRIRVIDTSAFSLGEPIDDEIIRRLKEKFGYESVEINTMRY